MMKALLRWLERQRLELKLSTLQAEYNADREAFDALCAKLSDDRRAIAVTQSQLSAIDGRHVQSLHQLRAR